MAFTSSMAVVGGKAGHNYPAPMLALKNMQMGATLGRDAAGVRLGQLLSGFHDVPALGRDHPKVARELSQLLPQSAPARGPTSVVSSIASGRSGSSGGGWAIFVLLFILLQMLFIVGAGPGE